SASTNTVIASTRLPIRASLLRLRTPAIRSAGRLLRTRVGVLKQRHIPVPGQHRYLPHRVIAVLRHPRYLIRQLIERPRPTKSERTHPHRRRLLRRHLQQATRSTQGKPTLSTSDRIHLVNSSLPTTNLKTTNTVDTTKCNRAIYSTCVPVRR